MRESRWLQFDPIIVGCAIALVVLGIGMIHSATCGSPCGGVIPPSPWAVRQGTLALVGFGALAALCLVDYRLYQAYAYQIYGASVALLILVLVVGRGGADNDYGARRWIFLGFFDLQVSEVGKLALALGLARFFSDGAPGPMPFRRLLVSLAMVMVPSALVFAEPDLGTAVAYIVIWIAMAGVAGIRFRHTLSLAAAALLMSPLAWLVMRDYMRQRVVMFIGTLTDLNHAAFAEGYNVLQARISVGSGGLLGRGYLQGTQTQLDYLRIKQSDFIFSAYAEELGFVGAMVLFALFILLIFRLTRAADMARDDFGRYLMFGVAAMMLFQVAVNLGANLTLLPVTGIPLPFISYGGTSLLVNLMALGIAESVLLYRVRYRF